MIDRALLAKIKKCLALSASSNEHEAAAALAMARRLMSEHGITDEDLAMADIEECDARGSRTQRPAKWEDYLCSAVCRAMEVQVIVEGRRLDRRYIGRGPSPQIASYAFVALFRRLKAARAHHIATKLKRCSIARKRVRADAFCEGWALSVFSKILALNPERIEDEGLTSYLARQYPGLVEIKQRRSGTDAKRTSDDYYRGVAAGSSVDLHHGMGGGDVQQLLNA